ncbi:unnamed protein product [Dibothriocephalus latus]|uniref:Uncharacterized protein n=1 Tax=Dibothriocephalus latus TaxID=60516 RepID=A0A3P7KZ90_DIBLA|nr:unnamed protein product [Dibothriocephalus latus]
MEEGRSSVGKQLLSGLARKMSRGTPKKRPPHIKPGLPSAFANGPDEEEAWKVMLRVPSLPFEGTKQE